VFIFEEFPIEKLTGIKLDGISISRWDPSFPRISHWDHTRKTICYRPISILTVSRKILKFEWKFLRNQCCFKLIEKPISSIALEICPVPHYIVCFILGLVMLPRHSPGHFLAVYTFVKPNKYIK
jgi:hypothetical protein